MKIIDAVWEKRNLGVTCYELQMEAGDCAEDIEKMLETLEERQYMVARVPSARYDLARLCQNKGYSFIEAAITLELNINKMNIPRRLLRICEKCSWEVMDETGLGQLSGEIRKNIFQTDRVYFDPAFTKEQAARRYDLWVGDLVQEGHIPYKVMLNHEVAGFFLNKSISGTVFDGLLAATYDGYEGSGMGYCIQYAAIMSAKERGAEKYMGHVSGNNPAILKVLLSIGFSIKKLEYIFIRHRKENEL